MKLGPSWHKRLVGKASWFQLVQRQNSPLVASAAGMIERRPGDSRFEITPKGEESLNEQQRNALHSISESLTGKAVCSVYSQKWYLAHFLAN